jgi:hypothetical protein
VNREYSTVQRRFNRGCGAHILLGQIWPFVRVEGGEHDPEMKKELEWKGAETVRRMEITPGSTRVSLSKDLVASGWLGKRCVESWERHVRSPDCLAQGLKLQLFATFR